MPLLDGLFKKTVPELPIAGLVIGTDAAVEPGYLYRVEGSDSALVITMLPRMLDAIAGARFAVKVYDPAPHPPGGTLTIMVPTGQQIEGDNGTFGSGIMLSDQSVGTYREWLCDSVGKWLLVGGI